MENAPKHNGGEKVVAEANKVTQRNISRGPPPNPKGVDAHKGMSAAGELKWQLDHSSRSGKRHDEWHLATQRS